MAGWQRLRHSERDTIYSATRQRLGRGLLLGLELLVLEVELTGRWPWQHRQGAAEKV